MLLAAWGTAAVPAQAAAPVESSDPRIAGATFEASPAEVMLSWTDEAMREAVPVDPPSPPATAFDLAAPGEGAGASADGVFIPGDVTAWPQRVHGKIFFRFGEQEYVCSGTVVNSRGRNVVMTAGHCVFQRGGAGYASEMIFVPGYDGSALADDQAPLGTWAAEAVFTTAAYVDQGRLSHDVAAVVLSRQIENPIGARRIAFDLDPAGREYTIFGYPVRPDPPFNGNKLFGCRSVGLGRDTIQPAPEPVAAGPCLMQNGASGGGWVSGGYLNSVSSYTYCDGVPSMCGLIYGPYFSSQAKAVYTYPAVGGSTTPTVRVVSGPRPRIRTRFARFTVAGSGSTPIGFRCQLDRRSYVRCGTRVIARRLSPGRHVLRVRSVDQTGSYSRNTARRIFRVLRR
jgi:hypothetical protein